MIPDLHENSLSSLEDTTANEKSLDGSNHHQHKSLLKSPTKAPGTPRKVPARMGGMVKSLSFYLKKSPSGRKLKMPSDSTAAAELKAALLAGPTDGCSSDDGSMSNSTPKSSPRRVMVRRLRRRSNQSPPPIPSTIASSKSVRFVDCNNSDCDVAQVVATSPLLTPEELRQVHYTRKELQIMAHEAQRLGEDTAWKNDPKVVRCLHFCYGFGGASNNNNAKENTSSQGNTKNSSSSKGGELTQESALQYYYYSQVKEETWHHNKSTTMTTTLRGLERQVSSEILEYRMSCVQAVLQQQTKFKEAHKEKTGQVCSVSDAEDHLRKASASLTHRSRKFARLLGKADAAVVGMRGGKSQTRDDKASGSSSSSASPPSSS